MFSVHVYNISHRFDIDCYENIFKFEEKFSYFTHLHACFSEINLHGNLLSGVDVRVVGFLERFF